jgi:DNA-binding GntR family transcriptional regulator
MNMKRRDTAGASTFVYETVKKRIIEYVYRPGAKLSEARLAVELGLGRSPIRSAFSRLHSEGFIEISPQSGSYVKSLNEQEIKEIFDLRMLLETYVAGLAAQRVTAEQLRTLRGAMKRVAPGADDAFDQFTFDEFDTFDALVHATIYEAAGNALIRDVLLNLLEKAQWLKKTISPSTPKRLKAWFAELEHIIEALESRDVNLTAQRVREHIGHAADFELHFVGSGNALAA